MVWLVGMLWGIAHGSRVDMIVVCLRPTSASRFESIIFSPSVVTFCPTVECVGYPAQPWERERQTEEDACENILMVLSVCVHLTEGIKFNSARIFILNQLKLC